MNIAMLSIHSCPAGELGTKDTGGMSVYIWELAKELGKLGCRIDIFTRRHDAHRAQVIPLNENVRLIHVGVPNDLDPSKLAIYPRVEDFAEAIGLFAEQEGIDYHLVHSHYWLSGLVGLALGKRWDIPQVVMFHTLGAVKNNLGLGEDEPSSRIAGEKALVAESRKIVAPTFREKENLVRFYGANPEAVSVIPCGVNRTLFQPVEKEVARIALGYDAKEKILLYVGRVEPLKGLNRIIESLSSLKNRMSPRLLIVGGDDPRHPLMDQLREFAALNGVLQQVVFCGRVDQKQLPLYYAAADALVVASHYESFGLVALEALSCGTPVVSTRVGAMDALIRDGENGALVRDDGVPSMAMAIFRVLFDSGTYEKNVVRIRKSTDGYSWPGVALRMKAVYDSVVRPVREA
jgi:D-inositol-3-phosphate glycosyltransferase